MQVIFLDIDGVLNTVPGNLYWKAKYGDKIPKYLKFGLAEKLDPTAVVLFNKAIDEIINNGTDIKIVISSSWRNIFKWNKLLSVLKREGIKHTDRIIAKTGYGKMSSWRGHEIQWWMRDYEEETGIKVEKYAIVDDNSDMLREQMSFFIQTNTREGFSCENAQKLIDMFKSEEQLKKDQENLDKQLSALNMLF